MRAINLQEVSAGEARRTFEKEFPAAKTRLKTYLVGLYHVPPPRWNMVPVDNFLASATLSPSAAQSPSDRASPAEFSKKIREYKITFEGIRNRIIRAHSETMDVEQIPVFQAKCLWSTGQVLTDLAWHAEQNPETDIPLTIEQRAQFIQAIKRLIDNLSIKIRLIRNGMETMPGATITRLVEVKNAPLPALVQLLGELGSLISDTPQKPFHTGTTSPAALSAEAILEKLGAPVPDGTSKDIRDAIGQMWITQLQA